MMERFVIRTKEDRSRCLNAVQAIRSEPLMEVLIQEYKEDRTLEQNAYLWGGVYATIRQFIFDSIGQNYTCEEIHEWCKGRFIDAVPKLIMGDYIAIKTTKGSKKKFSEYLERIFHHFAEIGCVIPGPEPSILEKVQEVFPDARVEHEE